MKKHVTISDAIWDEIGHVVANSARFKDPDDFVNFVLGEFLDIGRDTLSAEESRQLQQRLRDLGYL